MIKDILSRAERIFIWAPQGYYAEITRESVEDLIEAGRKFPNMVEWAGWVYLD